jgi:hypothetical protein
MSETQPHNLQVHKNSLGDRLVISTLQSNPNNTADLGKAYAITYGIQDKDRLEFTIQNEQHDVAIPMSDTDIVIHRDRHNQTQIDDSLRISLNSGLTNATDQMLTIEGNFLPFVEGQNLDTSNILELQIPLHHAKRLTLFPGTGMSRDIFIGWTKDNQDNPYLIVDCLDEYPLDLTLLRKRGYPQIDYSIIYNEFIVMPHTENQKPFNDFFASRLDNRIINIINSASPNDYPYDLRGYLPIRIANMIREQNGLDPFEDNTHPIQDWLEKVTHIAAGRYSNATGANIEWRHLEGILNQFITSPDNTYKLVSRYIDITNGQIDGLNESQQPLNITYTLPQSPISQELSITNQESFFTAMLAAKAVYIGRGKTHLAQIEITLPIKDNTAAKLIVTSEQYEALMRHLLKNSGTRRLAILHKYRNDFFEESRGYNGSLNIDPSTGRNTDDERAVLLLDLSDN